MFKIQSLILVDGRSGGWLPTDGFTTTDFYIKMTPDELADVRRLDGAQH